MFVQATARVFSHFDFKCNNSEESISFLLLNCSCVLVLRQLKYLVLCFLSFFPNVTVSMLKSSSSPVNWE